MLPRAKKTATDLRLQWVRISALMGQLVGLRVSALEGRPGATARWFWYRRNGARLILITAFAASVTWWLTTALGIGAPLIAAISAVLSVQAAVHASLKEGITRVGATITALLVAVTLFDLVGIHVWSVGIVVTMALVLGRLMGLGPEGSLQIPCTSLAVFTMGPGIDADLIGDRIVGTILGVLVGVALSFFAHPTTPAERASEELEKLSRAVGASLDELARGLRSRVERTQAEAWLVQSRELTERYDKVKASVEGAREAARWGSAQSRDRAARIMVQADVLGHSCAQLNSLARTVFDATVARRDTVIPSAIGDVIEHTARAFEANAGVVGAGVESNTALQEVLSEVREVRRDTLGSVRNLDDTGMWMLSGAILSDLNKMAEELDRSTPALEVGLKEQPKPYISAASIPRPRRKNPRSQRRGAPKAT